MKKLYSILLVLHVFVGIGAMAGGWAAIDNPQAPLGVSSDILENSPFSNFFIPGIILFTVIGFGNILSAVTICFKMKFQTYISCIFSSALVIWIIVQCIMINSVRFLHVIFFILGLIGVVLSMVILFKQRLFPVNIIENYYKKISKEI